MLFNASLLAAVFLVSSANAHGVVTAIKGANGVTGVGFGVSDVGGKSLRLFNQVRLAFDFSHIKQLTL